MKLVFRNYKDEVFTGVYTKREGHFIIAFRKRFDKQTLLRAEYSKLKFNPPTYIINLSCFSVDIKFGETYV